MPKNHARTAFTRRHCSRRIVRILLAATGGVWLLLSNPGIVHADFINGGFEQTGGTPSQPFPGWTVEYSNLCPSTPFFTTLPSGHPPPLVVTAASFNAVTLPAICDEDSDGTGRMARINDLIGQCHVTRISQSAVLTEADIDDCGAATVEVCWIGVFDHPTNGGHDAHSEPYFEFSLEHTVLTSGLTTVVDSVRFPSGNATDPFSGWTPAGSGPSLVGGILYYRQTCTPLIVLDAHPGDTVRITMLVRDCRLKGHGAMAFLDCAKIRPGVSSGTSSLFVPQTWSTSVVSSLGLHAGDVNCDGRSDLVDFLPTGSLRILESNGTSFNPPVNAASVPTGWTRMYTGDFDGDGCADVAGWDGSTLRFVWADASTSAADFDPVQSVVAIPGGVGARGRFWIGDWNGDGIDDFLRDTGVALEVALATGLRAAPLPPLVFNQLPSWGAPFSLPSFPGLAVDGYHVCDFDSDGRCDLMLSTIFGMMFWTSYGSSFTPWAIWRPEGPPVGGWSVGDFDCDGRCEAIRRTSTGVLELLDIQPPPNNVRGSPATRSVKGIPPGPYVVGDFDGDGVDDIAVLVPGSGVRVIRACNMTCPCLRVDVTLCCDYPDRTRYVLKINVLNLAGAPLTHVDLSPIGPFSVTPPSVPLNPPLQMKRRRTVSVLATGLTPGVNRCVSVAGQWTNPMVCAVSGCFTPPDCDCMDISFIQDPYCLDAGSGIICFDFSVTNASTSTVRYIRLSPASSFTPNLIPVNLLPGQTHSATGCTVRIVPGVNPIPAALEMLDADLNLICDESFSVAYPDCPTIRGECCIRNVGLIITTAADCAARGGTWSPPFTAQYCPWSYGGSGGSAVARQVVPRADSLARINEEQRLFIARRGSGGDPAADILTPAVSFLSWASEHFPADATIGTGIRTIARGGVTGRPVAILDSTYDGGPGGFYHLDVSGAGATAVLVVAEGDTEYDPILLPSTFVEATTSAAPDRIRASISDYPGTTHGFTLEFDEPALVMVEGSPVMEVHALHLLAAGGDPIPFLTGIGFRGIQQPVLASGIVTASHLTCLGDITGDCRITNADIDLFVSGAEPEEVDVNGDGVADITDLFIILAGLGNTCPCGQPVLPPCPGDANADGSVNFADITSTLTHFNTDYDGMTGLGDADLSGTVNFADISAALTNWGSVCP